MTKLQVQLLYAPWSPNGPAPVTEVPLELADDRTDGKAAEGDPSFGIEPVDRLDEGQRRDLDQVLMRLASIGEAPGQLVGEAEIGFDELVSEDRISGAREFGKAIFLASSRGVGRALRHWVAVRRFRNHATGVPFSMPPPCSSTRESSSSCDNSAARFQLASPRCSPRRCGHVVRRARTTRLCSPSRRCSRAPSECSPARLSGPAKRRARPRRGEGPLSPRRRSRRVPPWWRRQSGPTRSNRVVPGTRS